MGKYLINRIIYDKESIKSIDSLEEAIARAKEERRCMSNSTPVKYEIYEIKKVFESTFPLSEHETKSLKEFQLPISFKEGKELEELFKQRKNEYGYK